LAAHSIRHELLGGFSRLVDVSSRQAPTTDAQFSCYPDRHRPLFFVHHLHPRVVDRPPHVGRVTAFQPAPHHRAHRPPRRSIRVHQPPPHTPLRNQLLSACFSRKYQRPHFL